MGKRNDVRKRPARGIKVRFRPTFVVNVRYLLTSRGYVMSWRVRHCVECPKCSTRYLIGFSPYPNGSYLVPLAMGASQEWTLYCACGTPPSPSRWRAEEMKAYQVSSRAHLLGFGPPQEIVRIRRL